MIIFVITSKSITEVLIDEEPKGLPETTVDLFKIGKNSNGVSVQKVDITNDNIGSLLPVKLLHQLLDLQKIHLRLVIKSSWKVL